MVFFVGMLLAVTISAYAIGFDAETVYESVVVVYADNAIGSGFAIGENCIITNAHVVKNANSITVSTYGGESYEASVYVLDRKLDLAVLTVSQDVFRPLPIADVNACKIGDDIYTIGSPNSMAYSLTKGVISAKDRKIGTHKYIQIDAAINAGNSGGPLLNENGEVLGVNTMKMSDSEGIGLSIPINAVCTFLTENSIELNENNTVSGILIMPQPEDTAAPIVEPNGSDDYQKGSSDSVLIELLSISVLLNIVLIIVLIHGKRKTPLVKADPSERTDFEIEIEE